LTRTLVTSAKSKPLFQSRTYPKSELRAVSNAGWDCSRRTLSPKPSDVPRVGQGPPLSTAPQPASSVLRVLLVGDREEDFYLIREILEHNRGATPAQLDHAVNIGKARAMLHGADYGLVLFVHDIGDAAVGLLSEFLVTRGAIPFILLTENAAEKDVAEIIQAGALDCMERSELNGANLMRTVRCAVNLHAMQQQKQIAEQNLRTLSCAVEQSGDPVFITNSDGIIESVNHAFEKLTGYSHQDVAGKPQLMLKSDQNVPLLYRELWETIRGEVTRAIRVNRRKNGELYYVDESISPIFDGVGRVTHFVCNCRDLTERLRIEAQLVQSQKMDAVGRLAGGVAHDFNNLLTIITSYSELALDTVEAQSVTHARLQEILSAARRAAELTRQLLAFSRKQPQALRVAELNPVVESISKTLHRLIGEDIELNFVPGESMGRVRLDPVQIEQILMNLAVNSRDAMPQGGQLTLETADIFLDEAYVELKRAIIPPGRYAMLSVMDTGVGIPRDELAHIFEPFYTTKPAGRGTGLGLATVYGIVKQNQGFIWVYSEPGLGTTFKIYFPCVAERASSIEVADGISDAARAGTETLLLVEDEEPLRRAAAEFLRLRGYTVLEASNGVDALAVSKSHASQIDLAVSDVVMPYMSGGELARQLWTLRPETRVLFVSGYTGQTVSDHKVADVENNFLQKPFTLKQLAKKVRTILDQSRSHVPLLKESADPQALEVRAAGSV
jgi:two-component system cell cycle sensor histidine kinase/response regulator CckA